MPASSAPLRLRRARLGLTNVLGVVELVQQVLESVGNTLAHHLVVDALKDVADPSLILKAQAPSGPSNLHVVHSRL